MLEERLERSRQENTELKSDLASLNARLARHEQLDQRRAQQVLPDSNASGPVALDRARGRHAKNTGVPAREGGGLSAGVSTITFCRSTGFQSCLFSFVLGQSPGIQHARIYGEFRVVVT